MKHSEKILLYITNQLNEQGLSFSVLNSAELSLIEKQWEGKFIGNLKKEELDGLKWHAFSFKLCTAFEGTEATDAYSRQYAADCYIFNEQLTYGVKCSKADGLPEIRMEEFSDDIYICHHNMKWTYIITHEAPDIGPFFV